MGNESDGEGDTMCDDDDDDDVAVAVADPGMRCGYACINGAGMDAIGNGTTFAARAFAAASRCAAFSFSFFIASSIIIILRMASCSTRARSSIIKRSRSACLRSASRRRARASD